jgi:O-antigen ligase
MARSVDTVPLTARSSTALASVRLWLGRMVLLGLVMHACCLPISMAGMQISLGLVLGGLVALRLSGRPVWSRSPLDLPLLALAGAAVASLALASVVGETPVGWHEATLWRSILSPILILSGLQAIQREESSIPALAARRMALVLLVVWAAAALVPSGIAWIQHYTGFDPLYALGLRAVPVRPAAPFDPDHFAAAGFFHWYQRLAHNLIPPICLAAGVVAYGGVSRRLRVFLAVATAAATLAVVLTTSRLAWIGLAAAAALLAFLGGKRVMRWALPAAAAGAVLVALLLPGARERLLNTTALKENGDRVTIWRVCAAVVADHPLTGVGWGNLPVRSAPYWERIDPKYPLRAWCHNSFFSAWAEGGPLLFSALVLYWILLARAFWRWREGGDALARGASAGAMAGLLAMLLNSLGHDVLFSSETMYGLGFMIGVAAALARHESVVSPAQAATPAQSSV